MMLPTIHSNGTGRQTLSVGYYQAQDAVRKAIEALNAIEFNSRDYYPQGADAWKLAQAEQYARVEKLSAVRAELLLIHEHVETVGG